MAVLFQGTSVTMMRSRVRARYRLVLSEVASDRSADSLRKYRYNFSDLEGIVFGIATPETDKLDIIRIIQRKCAQENRQQFQFYQAYYARQTGRIDVLPLRLLRVE
jgi:hypothetical protein